MSEQKIIGVHTGQRQHLPIITTAQLLGGLHPFFGDTIIEEPQEAISKLQAILKMLIGCADEKTSELTVPAENVAWALILACDVLEEVEKRVETFQSHVSDIWDRLEGRIDACHVIPRGSVQWVPVKTKDEVTQ